ncbi:hypothetical protein N9051_01240 [Akkermansiaceae bacterium]|nr:hypothetical protein [Akkermansiaceae bacterium]
MINNGSQAWTDYNNLVRDQILTHQTPEGYWPDAQRNRHSAGTVYSTCLAHLMLEVYCRYLPTGE